MTAFLDLFSGIGGFALGAYRAGLRFDNHYFSEIEPYAVELYKKRFPEAEYLGDIKNVDYSKLPKGEYLVAGGFPCQPHSDAGLKKGADDERDLWPECRRMLRELRPRIALFENVRGLLTSPGRDRKGEFFNGVLSDIHACGYDAEWQIISAADAGAPHLRKRVWIVAYSDGDACGSRRPEPARQMREAGITESGDDMANAESAKRKRGGGTRGRGIRPTDGGETLAYSESGRRGDGDDGADEGQADRKIDAGERPVGKGGTSISDSDNPAPARQREYGREIYAGAETEIFGGSGCGEWWAVEPDVGRVAHGIPFRVDRLKGLGNAVVPQCAEMIFNLPVFNYWREKE